MASGNQPKVERRAKKRVRTTIELHVEHEDRSTPVNTRDICASGLSCYLPSPLSLFTKYRFRLFVPTGEQDFEEIDGEGIVVRVEEVEIDGENLFETAFFFQHLDNGHQKVLDSFLQSKDQAA